MQKNFTITAGKGFRIKFANGWEVSVQWGPKNYADNPHQDMVVQGNCEADSAEIAVFNPQGKIHGEIRGWQRPNEVLRTMNEVAKQEN